MSYFSPTGFAVLPPVIKRLIILNAAIFVLCCLCQMFIGYDPVNDLGLHYFKSPSFRPIQLVSYMFLHGNFEHLFFNMFALWMFGYIIENFWGSKRFLTFYMVTGIGAGLVQLLVHYITLQTYNITPDMWDYIINQGDELIRTGRNYTDYTLGSVNSIVNGATVGASGAIYGILLAFGMLFPDEEIYLNFLFPIKAKWFVIIYGAIELFSGLRNSIGDNTAHFAHLGGMIFGYILIKYWRKSGQSF